MIETRRLKNVVIFFQTILSFVLSRKIGNRYVIEKSASIICNLEIGLIKEQEEHNKQNELNQERDNRNKTETNTKCKFVANKKIREISENDSSHFNEGMYRNYFRTLLDDAIL